MLWEKLFADPISIETPQEIVAVQPQRTNNILEGFFRDGKRQNRKKNCTASLNKMLKSTIENTPIETLINSDLKPLKGYEIETKTKKNHEGYSDNLKFYPFVL